MAVVRVTFPCPDSLFQNSPPPCTSHTPLCPHCPDSGLSPLSFLSKDQLSGASSMCVLHQNQLKTLTVGFT